MKILHQVGHRDKWNIDAYNENGIGTGFIYSAFSFTKDKLEKTINNKISMVDLQFFGKKPDGTLGKFKSYPFHPQNSHLADKTATSNMTNIYQGIEFQEELELERIIVPLYYEPKDVKKSLEVIRNANKYLQKKKKDGFEYYMTIVLSAEMLENDESIDLLLAELTDLNIIFDGYYIVTESKTGYKKKINASYNYLDNVTKVLESLKGQDFKIIQAYANWDSLIFLTMCDIDYVTIGTYENLRNFNPERFEHEMQGGPSEGWYFSEKLLNFIKAKEITNIRRLGGLSLIENERNIFSDTILTKEYIWSQHKPDIHKNYLLAISRLLESVANVKSKKNRINFTLGLIENAQANYEELAKRKIYLVDESSDYFLGSWKSFLLSKQ